MKIPPNYPHGESTIRSRFGLGGDSTRSVTMPSVEIKSPALTA